MGQLDYLPENIECRMAIGSFIGTGARIEIPCGFQPYRVQLMNLDNQSYAYWLKGAPFPAALGRDKDGMIFFDLSEESIFPVVEINGFGFGALANINILGNRVTWIAWG